MLNGNEYELLLDFSLPHFVTAFPISPLIIISIFPESKTTPKNYFHLLYNGILFRFNSNHRDKKSFNKSIFILMCCVTIIFLIRMKLLQFHHHLELRDSN